MLHTILDEALSPWMKETGLDHRIVLSSRIRLARNFKGVSFTNRGDLNDLTKVDGYMRSMVAPLQTAYGKSFSKINLASLSSMEREVLVEKHLISPNLATQSQERSVIISEDSRIAIMVNEEDHLRIQYMELGLQ